jgi:hypothetical protein
MIFDISKKSVNICQILADIYKCIMIVLFVIMSVLGNEIQEAGMEKQVIQVYHVIRKRDHPAILGQHSPIATRRWNTILSSAYHCLEQKKGRASKNITNQSKDSASSPYHKDSHHTEWKHQSTGHERGEGVNEPVHLEYIMQPELECVACDLN